MRIRNFRPDDSASLAAIFHESVRGVGVKDYTQAQVEAWSPKPALADKFLARVSDGRSVFVAVTDNDNPIAFIELEEDGHIDCFYCHPDTVGTGVGTALYEQLERVAQAAGISRLYVEASEAACRFFRAKGFCLIERRNFERNHVQIHNYLMEKTIR
jgi:putative acetyltransferase